ncbi:MAG: TraB/GumN family protein [Methyloglobulus sp.]|nr:TraB/GumN family protein [Methyloglobulus sp.]
MRVILLMCLLWPCFVYAETSLWRISRGNNQLYIGGTVHLLSQSDYPLPDEFEQVFREANMLVLEADLDTMLKPQFQKQLLQSLIYSDGSTLKTNLKVKTYKALQRYCRANGVAFATLQKMKPALVVISLTLGKLQKSGQADAGVDSFFHKKAKVLGKKITGLETAESQIRVLADMGKGREDELIQSTIAELKSAPKFVDELKKAWRVGDLVGLEKNGINAMRDTFPDMNQNLLVTRNNAWIPKIKAMLTTPERELILVGALHLAGKDGVLAQLKQQGYVVEQY